MKFSKAVPSEPGYYWVIDAEYPDPFIAFMQVDISYPFLVHMWKTCRGEEMWLGEHKCYRFGDKIEKPNCVTNEVE